MTSLEEGGVSPNEPSLRAEEYVKRQDKILEWDVAIVSYKLGQRYYCTIDNVSPGAAIARADGDTREQAEAEALAQAKERLARTRRFTL